jgi:glycosyltransferase involved in cell wall biosynthesis
MKIVWFSEIKWNYLRTRKQQIISRKPGDARILFLEPFKRYDRNHYRLRTEDPVLCATIPFLKSAPSFPWRTVLDRSSARSLVDLAARARIQQILKRLDFDPAETGFIVSNIYAADIVARLPRKFLLYDCNDDHSSFPGMRSWTKAYFYKTSREADAVFASSQALLSKITEVRGGPDGCVYLGNGVDYAHFQNTGGASAETEPSSKPRLGYIGALAPWFDFDTVADLARQRTGWEIVLVGPVLSGAEASVAGLTALPNVFHLPAVSYDRLPGVLAQFTVGLIPFRYNELTRGVNPNKMYEYLACGLPVVATRFSTEVTRFPDVVSAVDAGPGFVSACDAFVESASDERRSAVISERARKVARDNDWDVIAAAFWSRVRELMDRP